MRDTELLRRVERPGTPGVLTRASTALNANRNMLGNMAGWFQTWTEPAPDAAEESLPESSD